MTKRTTKAQRAIAEAERLAAMLADAPCITAGALAPPAFIADRRLAPALAFWREHAGQLRALGTLERLDRFTFAMFCVYAAEFVAAQDDVLTHGYSVRVKTISGDLMPRENPSVARRDFAAKMVLEMSRTFGLSLVDRLNIAKLGRAADLDGGLFDQQTAKVSPEQQPVDGNAAEWAALVGRRPAVN